VEVIWVKIGINQGGMIWVYVKFNYLEIVTKNEMIFLKFKMKLLLFNFEIVTDQF